MDIPDLHQPDVHSVLGPQLPTPLASGVAEGLRFPTDNQSPVSAKIAVVPDPTSLVSAAAIASERPPIVPASTAANLDTFVQHSPNVSQADMPLLAHEILFPTADVVEIHDASDSEPEPATIQESISPPLDPHYSGSLDDRYWPFCEEAYSCPAPTPAIFRLQVAIPAR